MAEMIPCTTASAAYEENKSIALCTIYRSAA